MLFTAKKPLAMKAEAQGYARANLENAPDEIRVSAGAQECPSEVSDYIKDFELMDPGLRYPELRMWWSATQPFLANIEAVSLTANSDILFL